MTDVQILNLDDSSTRRASHISEEQDEQSSDDRNDSEDRKSTASKHDTPTGDEITNNTINEDVYKKPSKDINYNKNTLNKDDIKKTFEKNKINLSSTLSEDFVSRLDAKLKDLEEDGKKKKKPQKSRSLDSRPLFITTVKTGIFLDPPPELAALLGYPRSYNLSSGSSYNSQKSGEELMYSFSSQPRVLNINNNKYNAAKINKVPKINNDKQQVVNNDKLQNKPNVRMKRELNNQNNVINNKKDDPPAPCTNIMTDRRVCRGPAFLHQPVSTTVLETQAIRQAEARRRSMARRKAQTHRTRQLKMRLGTPPPVQGRKHEDIQTEEYLEEVFDHPLEMSIQTQTEPHLDRPLTPPFVPQKAGIDAATQIYPGELFQFDVEVKPILEVLVGKTIEQALMEVMEEDELAAIKEQQRRFKEIKDTELAEDARIEESERRKKEEMELRIMEQEAALKDQQDTQERVAAAVLTTGYIADLLPSVFSGLRDAGFMVDEIEEKVEDNFMNWLMNEIKTEMQRLVENKDFLSGYSGVHCPRSLCTLEEMIRDIVQTRAELYHALGAKDNKRLGLSDEETEEYGEMGGELGEEDYKKGYVMKFGGDDSESTTNV